MHGSTTYLRVKPAKLLPHTAHSDWINRTGWTSWAFTRWCDWHTSDKVAHYSIYRPRKDERLSWPWVAGYIPKKVPPPGVELRHVTHPSTIWARGWVTSLIRPTLLPLRHAATCGRRVLPVGTKMCRDSNFMKTAITREQIAKLCRQLLYNCKLRKCP